jgi:hypothetical protein
MSWTAEIYIGEMRPWPGSVSVRRGGEERTYVPERTCHVVRYPLGIHDDSYAEICSECRVVIEPDVYYCANCGARIEEE